MEELTLEKLVNFCKQYGFVFQGSEIYGGLANTWDYGPLGARLKNNIKDAWRKKFIQERLNSYELDPSILMHPRVWEASGHVASFADPLIDCKECKARHRVDTLIEGYDKNASPDKMTSDEQMKYIEEKKIPCPKCGKSNYTSIRDFNLLFETYRGVVESERQKIYLRPENAQGEYVNYLNVLRTMRTKLPFSIGQIGKAFRNEITPGNFMFRTIEFEQMEYQTFCKEGDDMEYYEYFKKFAKDFYVSLGMREEKFSYKDHDKLAHYAKAACDLFYDFPTLGPAELNGTHNRTNYDLSRHQEYSGVSHEYLDQETKEKYIPYIVESTYGVDRSVLAVISDAYYQEELEGEVREVLRFHPAIAPYKVTVLPLIKKYHNEKALEIYNELSKHFMTNYDDTATIGKRYRRSDVIGTPFCVTIDDNTLTNDTVTIRDRDTMEQIVIKTGDIASYIEERIKLD